MPKDLTKLSLKEFEVISNGDFDGRTQWNNGTLELTVSRARPHPEAEDDISDD